MLCEKIILLDLNKLFIRIVILWWYLFLSSFRQKFCHVTRWPYVANCFIIFISFYIHLEICLIYYWKLHICECESEKSWKVLFALFSKFKNTYFGFYLQFGLFQTFWILRSITNKKFPTILDYVGHLKYMDLSEHHNIPIWLKFSILIDT